MKLGMAARINIIAKNTVIIAISSFCNIVFHSHTLPYTHTQTISVTNIFSIVDAAQKAPAEVVVYGTYFMAHDKSCFVVFAFYIC